MSEYVRLCSKGGGEVSENGRTAPGRQLVPAQRRQLIAERIRDTGSVSVAALEAEFGVSPMTARRDLQILEREGLARRTHGGAVSTVLARDEDAFQNRLDEAPDAKRRLGRHAAALVAEGETVFVDCSSTAYYAVRSLLDSGKTATVLTNSVPVMDLIARADAPQIELVGLAGSLRRLTCSFVGPQTVRAIQDHFADKLLFSVKGLAPRNVLTDANPLEAEVKRTMIERARESILLIDGSKFDQPGLSAITPIADVDTVLISGGDPQHLRELSAAGVHYEEVVA
jgi:DeoR/GlpR family transcriptional regulator of sugar metabolism